MSPPARPSGPPGRAARAARGAAAYSPPSAAGAVAASFTYALRACLPRRRRLGLVLPALGALMFGLLARAVVADTADEAFATVAAAGLFSIILPIGCLVIGDAVLGAEVRSGTLHFSWLSPVARWTIVAGRWLAGTVAAAAVLGTACALAAVLAGASSMAGPMFVAAVTASGAYVALFVMFGALARRAVVWSLAAVVLGERLLGAALDGIAQLSPGWLGRAAFAGLAGAEDLVRAGVPEGGAAVWRLVVLTAVWLGVAAWRLGTLRLAGRSD